MKRVVLRAEWGFSTLTFFFGGPDFCEVCGKSAQEHDL